MNVYKFVKWDVPSLNSLKDSDVYQLYNKRNKLNREEKDRLFSMLFCNSYSKVGVPLGGWMFPFGDILKRFLVKRDGFWSEFFAPDKTSIRNGLTRIVEIREA